jgi:hypothetical protein
MLFARYQSGTVGGASLQICMPQSHSVSSLTDSNPAVLPFGQDFRADCSWVRVIGSLFTLYICLSPALTPRNGVRRNPRYGFPIVSSWFTRSIRWQRKNKRMLSPFICSRPWRNLMISVRTVNKIHLFIKVLTKLIERIELWPKSKTIKWLWDNDKHIKTFNLIWVTWTLKSNIRTGKCINMCTSYRINTYINREIIFFITLENKVCHLWWLDIHK